MNLIYPDNTQPGKGGWRRAQPRVSVSTVIKPVVGESRSYARSARAVLRAFVWRLLTSQSRAGSAESFRPDRNDSAAFPQRAFVSMQRYHLKNRREDNGHLSLPAFRSFTLINMSTFVMFRTAE